MKKVIPLDMYWPYLMKVEVPIDAYICPGRLADTEGDDEKMGREREVKARVRRAD